MTDIKRIDIKEFRERGYVHEINRLLLHPLGLALEVNIAENGTETLGGVWDYRSDPEGIFYGDDLLSPEKAAQVATDIEERGALRAAHLGYVVQPLSLDDKQLSITIKEPFGDDDVVPQPYLHFAGELEMPDDES